MLQALTHRSVAGGNNERLEFLGDSVLGTVVSRMIFDLRPTANEGELSRLRSTLVRDRSLATIAGSIGVGSFLSLGPGERKAGGFRRQSILADATEAILGAIYLDGGYTSVERSIHWLYRERLRELPDDEALKDPKTRLQEWLQARGLGLPLYNVVRVSGKPHEQEFEVECTIGNPPLRVCATGSSRRKAEQACAEQALSQLTAK